MRVSAGSSECALNQFQHFFDRVNILMPLGPPLILTHSLCLCLAVFTFCCENSIIRRDAKCHLQDSKNGVSKAAKGGKPAFCNAFTQLPDKFKGPGALKPVECPVCGKVLSPSLSLCLYLSLPFLLFGPPCVLQGAHSIVIQCCTWCFSNCWTHR